MKLNATEKQFANANTNERKCNDTWNDTEWTRYWGVDADEYECDDYANEAED